MAMFNLSFTDGEAIAINTLGNHGELNYDMSKVKRLLDVHRRGFAGVGVGGPLWSYATGLVGTDAQLTGSDGNFTLVLDAGAGTGLTVTITQLPDGDGDGVPDGCDICPGFDDHSDTDSDGVPDGCDNCPTVANEDQDDQDDDGFGDACDATGDFDHDGDTDLADYLALLACMGEPGQPVAPDCEDTDLDGDGDGDLADLVAFQVAFTGSL